MFSQLMQTCLQLHKITLSLYLNQVGYFEIMPAGFSNTPPGYYSATITYIEGTIDVTAVATSLNGNNYFIGYAPRGPRGYTGMTGMTKK